MITFKEYYEESKPIAPAVFLGFQETHPGMPPIELFDTTESIPEHGYDGDGYTVGRATLERLGFYVPHVPEGTPRGTPLTTLDDRKPVVQATEAKTKKNPFGFKQKQRINQGEKRHVPQRVFKQEMKAKHNKKDLLKPRRWQVNTVGKLVRLFGK